LKLPPKIAQIVKKAVARALGLGLLLALSYGVLGRWPRTATWACLGIAVLAFSVYTAWRDVRAKKPHLP
jgi:hypothetical protein